MSNRKALESLHTELAKVLAKELQVERYDPETGEPVPPSPAMLGVVRQFLKDNNVQAVVEKNDPLASLANVSMPFLNQEVKDSIN